jgi:hypothetical protein
MAWPRKYDHREILDLASFGFRQRVEVFGRALVQIDYPSADRTCGDLRHVGIRTVQQISSVSHCNHRQRIGRAGSANRRAFERVERDIHFRPTGTDLFADIKHGRFIPLAFANNDRAVDGERVKRPAHGVDSGLVGRLLIAATGQSRATQRRSFGHSNSFQG